MSPIMPSTINDDLKVATGKANADSTHVAVPTYMPLARPLTLEQALRCVSLELQEEVRREEATLIAVAQGSMAMSGENRKLQLILFRDEDGYQTFETIESEYEVAVLMDGDGRRYLRPDPLPREEALCRWMAGFLNWNCEVPGLYRLRYALIEQGTNEIDQ